MKDEEESENTGLKLKIIKTEIMTFDSPLYGK